MLRQAFAIAAMVSTMLQGDAAAQDDGPASLLRGVVVDAERVVPLKRARITVAWNGGQSEPVLTDGEGGFEVRVRPDAHLTITASKAGYAPLELGRPRGAPLADLEIRLARGSVIAGTVLDSNGRPAVDTPVLVRRTDESGTRYGIGQYTTSTDDRGEFRVGSLAAGGYAVLPRGGGPRARVVLNAPVAPETVVQAGPGEERWIVRLVESIEASVARAVDFVAGFNDGARAALRSSGTAADAGATISGRVFDRGDGPVRAGIVRAVPLTDGIGQLAATASDGRYTFTDLPAGTYRLISERSAYVGLVSGSRTVQIPLDVGASGPIVTVSRGERRTGVDITLPRGGVITGTVRDDVGEPVEGIAVQAWQSRWTAGGRMFARAPGVFVRRTDDRGRYRLFGLAPGAYYIAVSEDAESEGPAIFYPRSPGAVILYPGSHAIGGASAVPVAEGSEVPGVDVTLPQVQLATVRGRAVDGSGAPLRGTVTLSGSHRSGAPVLEPRMAQISDGAFLFPGVSPGEYVVQAERNAELYVLSRPRGEQPREFGMTFVTVSGHEVASVFLQTTTGSSISGRVLVKDDPTGRPPPGMALMAIPAGADRSPSSVRTARVNADGEFVMRSLFGPLRIALQQAPPGWRLDAVQIGRVNAADDPVTFGSAEESRTDVTVVLQQGGAEISGEVTGAGRAGALVIVFSGDREHWHARSRYVDLTAADAEGRFAVEGLPAGDYRVAALISGSLNAGTGEWQDPNVLAALLPFATSVTLSDGARASVNVSAVTR